MSLLTYEDARPWAKAIKEEVLERRMPPWGAVRGFGEFQDEGGLSQEELHLLADWVEGGAPEGDAKFLPEGPKAAGPVAAGKPARRIPLLGVIRNPVRLSRVWVERLPEGASLRAVARLPDGRVEPLLWIYNYRPKFQRAYVYRAPLALPAGTRIEVQGPPGALYYSP